VASQAAELLALPFPSVAVGCPDEAVAAWKTVPAPGPQQEVASPLAAVESPDQVVAVAEWTAWKTVPAPALDSEQVACP